MARPSIVNRADALALSIGSRLTVGTLVLACVLAIVVGASSMLSALQKMDRDLKVMNEQLAIANQGSVILNKTMDSLPPTNESLAQIVKTVGSTGTEVKSSRESLSALSKRTEGLNTSIGGITENTTAMRSSLQGVDSATSGLGSTIDELNVKIDPLAATQKQMLGATRRMKTGMGGMNASLAYVIRTLNYMTAPPQGGAMQVRAELDKKSLPPIPGLKVETAPVAVFPRGAWPIYNGR